jgi:hypothetical protein
MGLVSPYPSDDRPPVEDDIRTVADRPGRLSKHKQSCFVTFRDFMVAGGRTTLKVIN